MSKRVRNNYYFSCDKNDEKKLNELVNIRGIRWTRGHKLCQGFVSFKKTVSIKVTKEALPSLTLNPCLDMVGIFERYWHDKNYPFGHGFLFSKWTKAPYLRTGRHLLAVKEKAKEVVKLLMKQKFSQTCQNWKTYQEALESKNEEDIKIYQTLFQQWYETPSKWIDEVYPGEDTKRMVASFRFVLNEMHMKKVGKKIMLEKKE